MDSYVMSGTYSDRNYGSRDKIFVGKFEYGGDVYSLNILLHFPLPNLPSNAIITNARLRLRLEKKVQFTSGEKKAFYVYMVKEPWKESTITWNNQPGTDYYVTHFYVEDTTTTPRYLYITVTKAVKKWYGQDGSHANYGLKIMGENKPGYLEIHSKETLSGESYKPTLYIYYTLLTVTVSPTTVSLKQGESAALQVEVSAPDYQGTVSLSVQGLPSGAAYSFSQKSGTPNFNSVLTIAASSSTPPGTYYVYVVAESQEGVKYKKKITLKVLSSGDFSLAFNPSTITVPQGGSGSSTLVISFSGSFTGPVTLIVQSRPSGFTVNIAPSGNTAKVKVNVTSTVSPGTYSIVIKGTGGGKTHTATLTVKVQPVGFSLAFNPSTITVKQGGSASSSLSITPIGGFNKEVTFTVKSAPSGLNIEITPSKASPGSSVVITVTASQSMAPGSYNVVIRGEGGGKSATATLHVTVEKQLFNFKLQTSPSNLSVNAGEQAKITVTAKLVSGSPQKLTLSLSGLPSGTSYNFNPPTITPTGSSKLTIDTNDLDGSYSLVIKASGRGVTKQVTVSLQVHAFDFTLAVDPKSVEIDQGETVTIAIKVTKTTGATKKVKLSLAGLPSEASYSFSPNELKPTGTSILTINAGSAKGTFTLIVKAKADGKEKTATIILKINEKRCIVATATYGSEVSREVSFLRHFRDHIVLNSYAGQRFYVAFNTFYYSWSPSVAQYMLEHPWLKAPVRVLLYPLLGSLLVASYVALPIVHLNPEAGVYLAGTVASALIGLFYLLPTLLLVAYIARRGGRNISFGQKIFTAILALPLATLVTALVFQVFAIDLAVTIATSSYVLSTIATSAGASARMLGKLIFK